MHRNNDLFPDEEAVEKKIVEVISQQKNISFILSSSQNIDRIVSAYRACKRTGKFLVIDIYTAWVLEQVREITENMPALDWPEIKVFATHSQDERLKADPDYFGDFRKRLYRHRVKREELHATPESFLYFGKMSSFRLIDEFKNAAPPSMSSTRSGSDISTEPMPTTSAATKSPPAEKTRQSTSSTPIRAGTRQ